ncbi:hypothetical protein PF006_g26020 [Phytophthora fragariae]|uniref:RxLR effector protein n=1 Tax=Phytophthora fragariae TaxID=53985 RepID=A0A6A3QZ42_9STRA|nr:hypothetical protein PF011_g25451 [Phytophthora fragariae]KAE9086468.1 hypothetical protein PF006_g26020 [Phytophthora fragariae]KAE9259061.1 hypothetical protein PF008_g33461 [Phytophthora fragariae]
MALRPKSVTFAFFSLPITMLFPLRSPCTTLRAWRYWTPNADSCSFAQSSSGCFLR